MGVAQDIKELQEQVKLLEQSMGLETGRYELLLKRLGKQRRAYQEAQNKVAIRHRLRQEGYL